MIIRVIALGAVLFGLMYFGTPDRVQGPLTPIIIMQAIWGMTVFIGALAIYCLPSIIADNRKHLNRGAISVLNFFLGWTFIGWVIALIWANTANTETAK